MNPENYDPPTFEEVMQEKEDTITALRDEVEVRKDMLALSESTVDLLRSQLSARDAEVEKLKRDLVRQIAWKNEAQDELEDICNELPGVAFMDLPDGGSVTIAEQVRRMYAALLDRDAQVMGLKKYIKHNHGCAAISWREGAVHCTCGLDAVLTGEPGPGGEG